MKRGGELLLGWRLDRPGRAPCPALATGLAQEGYAIEQSTGKDAGTSRSLVCHASWSGSSPSAHARSRTPPSDFVPGTGAHRNAESCATSRWRTIAQSSSPILTDLQRARNETGARHGFGADEALRLLAIAPEKAERMVEDRIEERRAERQAIFDPGVLRTIALEQTTGEMTPENALVISRQMIGERRVIPLEGGRMTTLAVRAQRLDTPQLPQHVYRQQGATVERSIVLTGGWQTSKETAYVEATRARHGTEWHIARDQLGHDGQDPDRIRRLAQHMRSSRTRTPSLALRERSYPDRTASLDPVRPRSRSLRYRCSSRALRHAEPSRGIDHGARPSRRLPRTSL